MPNSPASVHIHWGSPTALPVGTHDVMVTNPDGSTDTLLDAWVVSAVAVEEKDGCGCATGQRGSGVWALVALAAVVRRRRIG